MKILALIWALCRDFFRGRGVVIELIVIMLFVGFFLKPLGEPFTWEYIALYLGWITLALSALSSGSLVWRNADNKLDILVLKADKTSLYFAVWLASMLITFFWMVIIATYVALLVPIAGGFSTSGLGPLALSIAGNTLLVSVLFLLFSPLTGRPIEVYVAILIIIISFGIGDQAQPWQRLEVLFPPLTENIKAGIGTAGMQTVRTLLYSAATLGLGLIRFVRREFIWS